MAEYRTADPNRKLAIRTEAMQIEQEMKKLGARAAALFPALYKENPNDPTLVAMMPRMMTTLIQKHRFKDVVAYGERLSASGKMDGRSAEILALALFAEHQFSEAQKVLEDAQAKNLLVPGQGRLLPSTKSYQQFWEAEKKLRAAEETRKDLPRVLLKTTKGDITLELFEDQAPGAVGNFVSLVEKKFYDGIVFHRVIPLFMAQGGDPNTLDENPANDGQGGPGYKIPCECERPDKRHHFSGSLSMAHAGKNTGGSQFFLTFIPTEHLNGKHTVFGRIVVGLDVQRSLVKGDKIITATVIRKRNHEYAPPAGKK